MCYFTGTKHNSLTLFCTNFFTQIDFKNSTSKQDFSYGYHLSTMRKTRLWFVPEQAIPMSWLLRLSTSSIIPKLPVFVAPLLLLLPAHLSGYVVMMAKGMTKENDVAIVAALGVRGIFHLLNPEWEQTKSQSPETMGGSILWEYDEPSFWKSSVLSKSLVITWRNSLGGKSDMK